MTAWVVVVVWCVVVVGVVCGGGGVVCGGGGVVCGGDCGGCCCFRYTYSKFTYKLSNKLFNQQSYEMYYLDFQYLYIWLQLDLLSQ